MKKYLDKSLPFSERAKALVDEMTLFEMASQTVHAAPAIERLNIPAYNWWNEALHGVARAGTATVFPQAIGMAAAFDEEMIQKVAEIISTEARAKFNMQQKHTDTGIYKGLTMWSPNINIFRDPRWGRGHETYGEDPYLTARLAVAFVKGLQGEGEYLKTAACAKHFAVHSGPESKRHEFDAIATKKDLMETYLPAFEALIKEAEVAGVMGAYNRLNGEPCCGSEMLHDILRKKWGFKGYFVSDCGAIKDFHEGHHVTSTAVQSVALALKNGCDLNCGNMYLNLMLALKEGLITEAFIRRSVQRLMEIRIRLGMFDQTEYDDIPYNVVACEEHRNFSLEVAKKSLVLLKNNGTLPLKNGVKIAVIGPNANSTVALLGNYHGTPKRTVTVLEGLIDIFGIENVNYSEGCHLHKAMEEGTVFGRAKFSESIELAQNSDAVILCVGLDSTLEGEEGMDAGVYFEGDKKDLKLPSIQNELIDEVLKCDKPVILVSMTGSVVDYSDYTDRLQAIIQAWYPGEMGGQAIAELICGAFSPSGRLPITFYKSTEDLPLFEDYSMANRTYKFFKGEPLYPFGFGLSYTKFFYSDLLIESGIFQISVKNIGSVAGDEVVQAYLQGKSESGYKSYQLVFFKRIHLIPGETKKVRFKLKKQQLAFYNEEGFNVEEQAEFNLFVGGGQPKYAQTVSIRFEPEVLGQNISAHE